MATSGGVRRLSDGLERRGAGILDLLVAVTVLGVMVCLVLPALGRLADRGRSEGGARGVASVLALGREMARAHGVRHGVLFLRGPDRWVLWREEVLDGRPGVEEIVAGPTELLEGSRFGGRPGGGDPIALVAHRVIFLPSGAVNGLPGSLYLASDRAWARVTVLTNGRIAVERGAVP